MEEDIKLLEEWVKESKQFEKDFNFEKFFEGTRGHERILAIENLINKYKEQERDIRDSHILLAKYSQKNEEQEKIIELMAKDIAEITDSCPFDFNDYELEHCEKICTEICQFKKEYTCFIEYYEKKAKGE